MQAGATELTGEVEIYADDEAEVEERFQIAITFGDVGDTVEYAGSIYVNDRARPASRESFGAGGRGPADATLRGRAGRGLDAGSEGLGGARGDGDRVAHPGRDGGVGVWAPRWRSCCRRPAAAGESVAVSYLPWAMHPLLGPQGAEAGPLTELPVRNETPASVPVEPPLVPVDVGGGSCRRNRRPEPRRRSGRGCRRCSRSARRRRSCAWTCRTGA